MPIRHKIQCTCDECPRRVRVNVLQEAGKLIFEKRVHGGVHRFELDLKEYDMLLATT